MIVRSALLIAACLGVSTPTWADVLEARPPHSIEEARSRASEARARLNQTEAGRIVLKATEAHGGLDAWFAAQTLKFRYDYQPVGKPAHRRNSVQTVDLIKSRAYHDMDQPAKGQIAWDGQTAWATFPEPEKKLVRFWALTPYYFVAMPFVLGDPGVNLQILKADPAAAGLPDAHAIKVTYGANIGDAPDDYYIVYFAREDGRLLALRYVVTYGPLVKMMGIKHTPEKLLVYEDVQAAGALKLARTHTFYAFPEGKRGDHVTTASISEVQAQAPFDEGRLVMPENGHIDHSMDAPAQ